jgi:hypothetical protein
MNSSHENELTEIRQKVKQLLVSNLGQLEMLDPQKSKMMWPCLAKDLDLIHWML